MIWTLKVDLQFGLYAESDWGATIEIDSESTLEELHLAIQAAVGFANDHMYEFYVARTERSRDRIRFTEEDDEVFGVTLENLYPLPKDRKLYYLFDYGDSWLFKITKLRHPPEEPKQGENYPRKASESGSKPEQYPEWEE